MIPYKQLSLSDFFSDCQNKFDNDKYEFLSILEETINLDEIVPVSFIFHFHVATSRPTQAPSLSDAQGSVITAYFLNSNYFSSDCIFKILSRITGFPFGLTIHV